MKNLWLFETFHIPVDLHTRSRSQAKKLRLRPRNTAVNHTGTLPVPVFMSWNTQQNKRGQI
jgi:hypothetical protein